MPKVNPTVITLGIAGILAIAVGFYVNSVSWGPLGEEKTTQAAANSDSSKPANANDTTTSAIKPTWAASATGRVEPKSGEVRITAEVPGRIVDLAAGLNDRVKTNAPAFRRTLERLLDLPIVGDVRGEGYFYGIELVKDKETKATFNDAESEKLLRGFLSKALYEAGIYCRADDRGDPVVQVAPPLICDQSHFDEMEQKLRDVLTRACDLL